MIFVTVGTHQQPFRRLIRALRDLPSDQLVVQYGCTSPPAGVARAYRYLSQTEMLEYVQHADVVITHAGVGSILCATAAGHVPIVVPRLARYGEHVDDHQVELAEQLGHAGKVVPVLDVDELGEAVRAAPKWRGDAHRNPQRLQAAVRAAMLGRTPPGTGAAGDVNAQDQTTGTGRSGIMAERDLNLRRRSGIWLDRTSVFSASALKRFLPARLGTP